MLREFRASDLTLIVPQESQVLDVAARERILQQAVPRGPCWTATALNGRIIGVGGFAHVHEGWATAWTILSERIEAAMVPLTRAVRGRLRAQATRRIDMHVDPSHLASARWAAMLGFQPEAWLKSAQPDGRAMAVWLYRGDQDG